MPNTAPESKILGILGGLGPMATAYFYQLVTAHVRQAVPSENGWFMPISPFTRANNSLIFVLYDERLRDKSLALYPNAVSP